MSFEKHKKIEKTPKIAEAEGYVEKKTYILDSGSVVEISCCEFIGCCQGAGVSLEESNHDSANNPVTIFLPGWSMESNTKSVNNIGKLFAESSRNKTYSISARSENMTTTDTLNEESKAIAEYVRGRGIKNINLIGYSQGGDKAIDVAAIIQDDPKMIVESLVLIGSTGLYEQTPTELITGFLKDTTIDMPKALAENTTSNIGVVKHGVRLMTDVIFGIANEVYKSKLDYPSRYMAEMREMAAVNPRLAGLRMPIIIISGAMDLVSRPDKIIPPSEINKIIEECNHENGQHILGAREEFLRKNLFPSSPHVRMLIAERLGYHGALHLRSEQFAKVSMYMIDRAIRKDPTI